MRNKHILVTGAPRSGTTALGRMIGFSRHANYLWEPFNDKYWHGVPDYYPYIGKSTKEDKKRFYDTLITNAIHLRNLKPIVTINPEDSLLKRAGKKLGINRTTFLWYKTPQIKQLLYHASIMVLKDPIGIFLSGYLAQEHGFKIIATIRHPAAVASSRKKLNWVFNFDWWRNQEDFYADHFKDIDDQLKKYELDFIEETAFHWLTCYSYIQKVKEQYPDKVMIVRHEDMSEKPISELQKVFEYVGLPFEEKIQKKIVHITSGTQLEKSTSTLATLERRDGKRLVFKWKKDTTQKELDIINEITRPVSSLYYKETEYHQI
jgi:hypothetical protein